MLEELISRAETLREALRQAENDLEAFRLAAELVSLEERIVRIDK